MSQLQRVLIEQDGHSPLGICKAIRRIIVTALQEELPKGLFPYQTQVSNTVFEITLRAMGEELIVDQARQSGKTEAIIISLITLSIYFARIFRRHFRVGIFAPANSQAILVFKERLRQRCSKLKPVLAQFGLKLITGDSVYSELFVIRNMIEPVPVDARFRCLSIGKESNVTSETFHLIIIEQSEDVDPLKMTQEVFPMAAAVGGARILNGTPKNKIINTYFYDAVTKKRRENEIITVDYEEASKYNEKYAAYVQEMRERLGSKSIAFQTQYELKWVLGADKFTTLEEMRELSRKTPAYLPLVDGKPLFRVDAGWDVAKESDRSIATWGFSEGYIAHMLEWMEFEGTDYAEQAETIAQRALELGTTQMYIDSAGPGDPVVDIFKKELRQLEGGSRIKVQGILTNSIREEDTTSKLMMDLWKHRNIDYPTLQEAEAKNNRRERARFIEEFIDLNKIWKGNLLRLEHPEGADRHDDYPKSCGLLLRSLMKPTVKLTMRELSF